MPYSALHAMMCCHTNESDPAPPPVLPFFLDSQRVRFLDFFTLSIFTFPYFFSTTFRSLSDDESIQNLTNRNTCRDRLTNARRGEGRNATDKLTGEREEANPAKRNKKKEKRKKKEILHTHTHMYDVALYFVYIIVSSFRSFSFLLLDSIPRRYLFLRYVQDRKCKTRKPAVCLIMRWKIIYSDLFWDHDQLLSC